MNNALYLLSVWGLIPLAVIVVAIIGRPVLALPHRLFKRLSPQHAYEWSVVVLALSGALAVIYLTLQLAFSTGGQTFPPAELMQLNLRTLYLFLILFGVPLAVVGLVIAGKPLLVWPHRILPGFISAESAYALSGAVLIVGGALVEVWLMAQLMAS